MKMSLNRSYAVLISLRCLQHSAGLPLYPACTGLLLLQKEYLDSPKTQIDARITPLTSGYVTELGGGRVEIRLPGNIPTRVKTDKHLTPQKYSDAFSP